jgi:hypothetical protein
MFFLLASRSFIDENPYAHDVLTHNTKRLNSMFDLNLTMKHLAQLNATSADIEGMKNATAASYEPVSLFHTKIPNYRA